MRQQTFIPGFEREKKLIHLSEGKLGAPVTELHHMEVIIEEVIVDTMEHQVLFVCKKDAMNEIALILKQNTLSADYITLISVCSSTSKSLSTVWYLQCPWISC